MIIGRRLALDPTVGVRLATVVGVAMGVAGVLLAGPPDRLLQNRPASMSTRSNRWAC